jgi:hypothetical protein
MPRQTRTAEVTHEGVKLELDVRFRKVLSTGTVVEPSPPRASARRAAFAIALLAACGVSCSTGDSPSDTGPVDVDGDGVFASTDCDDADPKVGVATTWFRDLDGDGYGDTGSPTDACAQPDGYVADATDCDDGDASVHPGAAEVCGNKKDDDCSGEATDCEYEGEVSLVDVGLMYWGEVEHGLAGTAVSGGGDVNGDGFGDIVVLGSHDETNKAKTGVAYVVLGSAIPSSGPLSAAAASYEGEAVGDEENEVLGGLGDVDGDGLDDFLIGAPENDVAGTNSGAVYLVLGAATPAGGNLSTSSVRYKGEEAFSYAGLAVALAGDLDGDGLDDLVVGGHYDDGKKTNMGAAWLIWGRGKLAGGSLASADVKLVGALDDAAGHAVAGAGDMNADGYADLVIGAPASTVGGHDAGAIYLVFGGPGLASSSLSSAGVKYVCTYCEDYLAGDTVAGAGDVNGDGFADVLVGVPDDDSVRQGGAESLILGAASFAGGSLADVGVEFYGSEADMSGSSMAGVGDANGDGWGDMLIGAPMHDVEGAAYLVPGGSEPAGGRLGSTGAVFGTPGERTSAGQSVSIAGDVNGDGMPDFLVGAPGMDVELDGDGAAFLLLGRGGP